MILYEEDNIDNLDIISTSSLILIIVTRIVGCILRIFNKRGIVVRTKYFQLHVEHIKEIKEIKHNMRTWFQEKNSNLHINKL